MSRGKTRGELSADLQSEVDKNDSTEAKIEVLLIQILRVQKDILAEIIRQGARS